MEKNGVQNDSPISDLKKKKEVSPKKHLHAYRKIIQTEKVIFEATEAEMFLK